MADTKTCIITGANGYVGGRLKYYLEQDGWRVVSWTRKSGGADAVSFRLGQDVDPALLKNAGALVHCAYDFGPRTWKEIEEINVAGSQKLLQAARTAGLERVVFISSLSAFAGCRSLYGRAKMEIEGVAKSLGATVIRPGLVYGEGPGGMFGNLTKQVTKSRFVPILVGGKQTQYLVHEADLAAVVRGCLKVAAGTGPILVANEQGWELKEILGRIAQTLGRRVTFVPVPWQFVWMALKSLEVVGARPAFRSDSLISMVYQDPSPSFALLEQLGFACRPFQLPGTGGGA